MIRPNVTGALKIWGSRWTALHVNLRLPAGYTQQSLELGCAMIGLPPQDIHPVPALVGADDHFDLDLWVIRALFVQRRLRE